MDSSKGAVGLKHTDLIDIYFLEIENIAEWDNTIDDITLSQMGDEDGVFHGISDLSLTQSAEVDYDTGAGYNRDRFRSVKIRMTDVESFAMTVTLKT